MLLHYISFVSNSAVAEAFTKGLPDPMRFPFRPTLYFPGGVRPSLPVSKIRKIKLVSSPVVTHIFQPYSVYASSFLSGLRSLLER